MGSGIDGLSFCSGQRALVTGGADSEGVYNEITGLCRQSIGTTGIVVSRIPDDVSTDTLNRELLAGIKQLSEDELRGALVVVEIGQIRIRR